MLGATLAQPFGRGASTQQIVLGTTPAAGASFTLNLDPSYVWRLVGCMFTLTTSAVAANRYVTVEYQTASGTSFMADSATVLQTASLAQRYIGSVTQGVSEWNTGTDVRFVLTPLFLRGEQRVKINVAAIDATDALTAISLVFDRYVGSDEQLPADLAA